MMRRRELTSCGRGAEHWLESLSRCVVLIVEPLADTDLEESFSLRGKERDLQPMWESTVGTRGTRVELFHRLGWCHRPGSPSPSTAGGPGAWEGTGLMKAGGLGSHACLSWRDPDKPF